VLETHSSANQVTKAVKKQASDNSRQNNSLNDCTCVLGNVCAEPSLMRQPKAKIYERFSDARYQLHTALRNVWRITILLAITGRSVVDLTTTQTINKTANCALHDAVLNLQQAFFAVKMTECVTVLA